MTTITIDNIEYSLEEFSDNARAQLSSLQFAEQKINQLQADLALTQTARIAYSAAVTKQLPAQSDKQEGGIQIDGKYYLLSDFSNEAKAELESIRITDLKLSQIQSDIAIAQTARNAYAIALKEALPKPDAKKANQH